MLNDQKLDHILQRSIRTETRLTRLCKGLGIDVTAGEHKRMVLTSAHPPIIELVGLDTTLAELLVFCQLSAIISPVVTLMHRGQVVGSIAPQPLKEIA